jgi:hypothetical protein
LQDVIRSERVDEDGINSYFLRRLTTFDLDSSSEKERLPAKLGAKEAESMTNFCTRGVSDRYKWKVAEVAEVEWDTPTLEVGGAGNRDRTDDIQLGKLTFYR